MLRLLKVAVIAATLGLGASSAAAHDGGVSVRDDHGQVDFSPFGGISTPLAPSENVEYVTGDNSSTGGHVVVEGKRLYLGSYGHGMRIYDISHPANPRLIGQYTPGLRADAVPDAARYGHREIAVLNGTRRVSSPAAADRRTDKSEFLDVTDAANPRLLSWFIGQSDGEAHNGDIVDRRKLWLPSGGANIRNPNTGEPETNGLRIYDISPTVDTSADKCTPAGTGGDKPDGTGNPCAPRIVFRGDPVKMWETSPYRGHKPVGAPFTHTHDITVYTDYRVRGLGRRDIALLAEGGNYTAGNDSGSVFVIDITDPRNPVVLQRWLHEKGPDHHPIRYHHEAQFLAGDPRLMLVTDEDLHSAPGCGRAGGVVAVRLSDDLRSAQELSEWFIPTSPAPVCSVHVFSSVGRMAFFGSYNAGLQVVDYRHPTTPRRAGYYIAEGATSWGAQYLRHGLVYIGDMSRGLDVVRYTGPGIPRGH